MHRRIFPVAATVVLASSLLASLAAPASATDAIGNPQQGKRDFAVCAACHQVGPHARNGVGPVLNGVVGRKAGSYPGYSYSTANKNSGLTWSVAELQKYLASPQKVVPGTKMPFAGLPDQKKVDDIIAYLAEFDEKGEKAAE
jgi:cytochrome c